MYPPRDASIILLNPPASGTGHLERACIINGTDQGTSGSDLDLRTQRIAANGSGVFQVFRNTTKKRPRGESPPSSNKHPSPARTMTSQQDLLVARWAAAMGYVNPHTNFVQVVCHWADIVPPRIGSDESLDLAVQYLIESAESHRLSRTDTSKSTQIVGAKAIRSLQTAIDRTISTQHVDDSVLLATLCHWLAELFVGVGSFYYILHIQGLSKMLQIRLTADPDDKLARMMIQDSYFEDVIDSMLEGHDSVFDSNQLVREEATSPSMSLPAIASTALQGQMIKLPRLCRLVRSCSERPDDSDLFQETVALAERLYLDCCDLNLDFYTDQIDLEPTATQEVLHMFVQSYRFPSVQAYNLLILSYAYQVLLCGLLQSLLRLQVSSPVLDLPEIQKRDLQAATNIGMSADYALIMDPTMAMAALNILIPSQLSLGPWHRLEKRSQTTEELTLARQKQEWIIMITSGMLKKWKAIPPTLPTLQMKMDGFAGGAMLDGFSRKKKLAQRLAGGKEDLHI